MSYITVCQGLDSFTYRASSTKISFHYFLDCKENLLWLFQKNAFPPTTQHTCHHYRCCFPSLSDTLLLFLLHPAWPPPAHCCHSPQLVTQQPWLPGCWQQGCAEASGPCSSYLQWFSNCYGDAATFFEKHWDLTLFNKVWLKWLAAEVRDT